MDEFQEKRGTNYFISNFLLVGQADIFFFSSRFSTLLNEGTQSNSGPGSSVSSPSSPVMGSLSDEETSLIKVFEDGKGRLSMIFPDAVRLSF